MDRENINLSEHHLMKGIALLKNHAIKKILISQPKLYIISNAIKNTCLRIPLITLEKEISEKLIDNIPVDDEYIIRMITWGLLFPQQNEYLFDYIFYLQATGRNMRDVLTIF